MAGNDSAAALYILDGSTLRAAGGVNGMATLDSLGTLTPAQIPASIANGLTFRATWNATTNNPTLPPVSTPDPGDFWIVTTAGNTALPGAAGPWTVGQAAVYNGATWSAVPYYALAVGLPVAGASSGFVLYVDGSGLLQTAARGTTSGVQAWSAALDAVAAAGTITSGDLLAAPAGVPVWSSLTEAGFGTLATQSGTFSGTSSGTNTGDQTISLTGDCTAPGSTGALTTTVAKVAGVTPGATGLVLLATATPAAATSAVVLTPTATKTGTYTAVSGDMVCYDATGGTFSIKAPTPGVDRAVFAIKETGGSATAITVDGNGANVDRAATLSLGLADAYLVLQYSSVQTRWIVR